MDINAEQKRIAFQDPKGHALLKGVAGSGKTSVGICRIPFLLQNYCFAKDDAILVATYNRTLVGYMTHLYEKMDCKEFAAFNSLFEDENFVKPTLIEKQGDYGVPMEWLDDVCKADEDGLLLLADHLPGEAAEALLELATGGQPQMPVKVASGIDPFEHPDAQRRFRIMTDTDELARALD